MAATIVALVSVTAFAVVLAKSGVVAVANRLSESAVSGVTVMLDSSLDDDTKERALRRAGLTLLVGSWQVLWRFAVAFGAVAVPILLADVVGWVPRDASFRVLLRVDFIAVVSIVAIVVVWAFGHRKTAAVERITESSAQGPGDRLIHALAFSGPGTLRTMARLDDRLFASAISDTPDTPPIFITSLARGGTTALLNAMHDLPQIATHRYCDMPFISAPLLWSKVGGYRSGVVERERAHGDGLTIGLQSPEAFDEIFWMLHWPEKYGPRRIDPWGADDAKDAATAFFTRHFRKIVRLRCPDRGPDRGPGASAGARYLSKNNANIARLDLLPVMFPGCDIIIPLREPAAHAASLLRQHINFSALHARDAFSQRYMRDIGHLEFGALHRPIGFDTAALAPFRPEAPDYWLAYWITAYHEVGRHVGRVTIVTQQDQRQSPQHTMTTLMERLRLTEGRDRDFARYFRSTHDPQPTDDFDPDLLRQARQIYDELAAHAVR